MRLVAFAISLFLAASAAAQEEVFWWQNQEIKGPDCLTIKWVYEGGSKPCTENDYRIWLETQQRWRSERLIRVGYDGCGMLFLSCGGPNAVSFSRR
jgi:hypothetical protein